MNVKKDSVFALKGLSGDVLSTWKRETETLPTPASATNVVLLCWLRIPPWSNNQHANFEQRGLDMLKRERRRLFYSPKHPIWEQL